MNEKLTCPKCNKDMAKIVYGYPTEALVQLVDSNGWMLGGCSPSPIKFYCKNCKVSWSEDFGFDS